MKIGNSKMLMFPLLILESRPLAASWEFLKVRPDIESTPIETEIRERRIERSVFVQLKHVECDIT